MKPLGHDLITITQRPETVFAEGHGSWLTDEAGKRHLDLIQGWAVNSLGHSPALITEALLAQSRRLLNPSPAYFNRPMLDLAAALVRVSGFDRVFLANSGAEANEGAVKLARRWGRRHRAGAHEVISFEQGFHGRTLAMMSASGKPGWDCIYAPMPAGFAKARLNDIDSVVAAITPQTVAVMIEFVQGEAGAVVADPGFVRELRALTRERGVLLIADEVQTGVGRCGTAFAFEHFDVDPDVLTLAKGLGGGVPLSALLCRESLNCFEPGDQGGTFCGAPLMAAVGLAVVNEVCRPAFLAEVRARADQLSAGLRAVVRDHGLVGERGLGLLRALELPSNDAPAVVAAAQALEPVGLLLNAPRPHLLRLMPALNISAAEVDAGLALLRQALRQVLA
ncbi:MAG: acetylornithine transaminase [Burkholderiales bacterium]|nr:MAG: acetylornithine transaminase [Burkholderiales bacterium]